MWQENVLLLTDLIGRRRYSNNSGLTLINKFYFYMHKMENKKIDKE